MSCSFYQFQAKKKRPAGIISTPTGQSLSIKFSLQNPINVIFNFCHHSPRHPYIIPLIENGANINDVREHLGHSNMSITMDIYVHNTDKMKNETVDIFEKAAGLSTT